MAAFGVYVRTLREGQHISRTGLADQLDVDATTLWRVEEGKQEPSGSLLVNLVTAVRGTFDDVHRLVVAKGATQETGREMAEYRLSQLIDREASRAINGMGKDEARRLAQRLKSDPKFFEEFIRSVVDPLDN